METAYLPDDHTAKRTAKRNGRCKDKRIEMAVAVCEKVASAFTF